MNRLVRERYPVSKLPEDLREGLDGQDDVTITIEVGPTSAASKDQLESDSNDSWIERGRRVRQMNFSSSHEVDAYVRSLRD